MITFRNKFTNVNITGTIFYEITMKIQFWICMFFHHHFFIDRKCVFWNTNSNSWSDNGCTLLDYSEDFTQCECDHLTNFGTIMDINGNLEDNVSCIIAAIEITKGEKSQMGKILV